MSLARHRCTLSAWSLPEDGSARYSICTTKTRCQCTVERGRTETSNPSPPRDPNCGPALQRRASCAVGLWMCSSGFGSRSLGFREEFQCCCTWPGSCFAWPSPSIYLTIETLWLPCRSHEYMLCPKAVRGTGEEAAGQEAAQDHWHVHGRRASEGRRQRISGWSAVSSCVACLVRFRREARCMGVGSDNNTARQR